MVDVGDGVLAVTVRGNGPPVLFVAGLGEPGANWAAVIEHLREPMTTLTYDRPGVGASPPLADPHAPRPYSFFARQLDVAARTLGIAGPLVVVGHSFGCLIARVFARLLPQRVAGLVLVDGSMPAMAVWADDNEPRRDGDGPDATTIDTAGGAREIVAVTSRVPAVVVTRTPGRWDNHPKATSSVDHQWSLAQRQVAAELDAAHVIATDGGHSLNAETPRLVALAVDAVVRAWVSGQPVGLDPAEALAAGGSVAGYD